MPGYMPIFLNERRVVRLSSADRWNKGKLNEHVGKIESKFDSLEEWNNVDIRYSHG